MLTLARRPGEEVVIRTPEGREIRVLVTRIEKQVQHCARSGSVRLSFVMDDAVTVNRREVQDIIDTGTRGNTEGNPGPA
jgi:sRNA-binding carbon storage regulator CsrA